MTAGQSRRFSVKPSRIARSPSSANGSQTRSFCYVEDEIRGLIALAESGYHDPVNIGNPDEFTLLELAEVVIEVTGSSSETVFEALPTDDPKQRRPDITLALAQSSDGSRRSTCARGCGGPSSGRAAKASWARSGRRVPPTDCFVISFAASPARESLPYGRWAEDAVRAVPRRLQRDR